MKRNRELEIQIMQIVRADEGLVSTVSYKDFDGITVAEFIEHCKILDEEGLVEAQLASKGVAHIRLTARGHNHLDSLDLVDTRPSRKLGF